MVNYALYVPVHTHVRDGSITHRNLQAWGAEELEGLGAAQPSRQALPYLGCALYGWNGRYVCACVTVVRPKKDNSKEVLRWRCVCFRCDLLVAERTSQHLFLGTIFISIRFCNLSIHNPGAYELSNRLVGAALFVYLRR